MTDALKLDLAADVLSSFGQARLPVSGFSMFPCMRPGDLLEIRRPAGPVRIGEVVVFARHGRLVVHRVVAHTGDLLATRGDRVRHPDYPISAAEILGSVAAIERHGRRLSPDLTLSRRMAAAVLRRSEFAARALHYFARMVRT
ncbi:MAG: S24/S26 family peptidase [Bryobacteraceae bacterium]